MSNKVNPYNSTDSKKEQVRSMFDNIAHRYDFLNRFLSMGIDKGWRKKAVKMLREVEPKRILDVATGTADFAIETLKLNPDEVIGVDISVGMLEKGKGKLQKRGINNIHLEEGDSENLRFEDNYFDAIVVGFGVRNFENLEKGLTEMNRVLRPGGKICVLEFSKPRGLFSLVYAFYFNVVLPLWGKLMSGDNSAYTYLPESVKVFPEGEEFKEIMQNCGYQNVKDRRLTFGICSIYSARK
ncbi:MAG: bifunctional demethylmenaquinone methyltransferase/2-methoxy-6-polyprenyl-1,4-benzoquinol methylase UbiE [Bacteroidia bacterium]